MRLAHRDDTPYLAEYAATDTIASPDLQSFTGVILVHTAKSAEQRKVITYWRSCEHFNRHGDAFGRAIGGATTWHGYVRDYRERRESFLRRIKWYTTIVTIIAVLGACENGRTWFNRFAAIPVLQVYFDSDGETNVFPDDTVSETLKVANHLPTEQRVDITDATIASAGTPVSHPSWDPRIIPELRENETVPIRIVTRAGTPGDYVLTVWLRARAGRLRDPLPTKVTRRVVVWSREPRLASKTIARIQHDGCFIACELSVGMAAPQGVSIDIRLARHPEVTEAMTDIPGARVTSAWQLFGGPGANVSTLTIKTQPVPAFHRLHFTLALTGPPTTRWSDIAGQLDVIPTRLVPESTP